MTVITKEAFNAMFTTELTIRLIVQKRVLLDVSHLHWLNEAGELPLCTKKAIVTLVKIITVTRET